MPNKWWVRPLLAFMITFGALAIVRSIVRAVAVFLSLGMAPDDPTVTEKATRELSRLDQMYTPTFLLVAVVVSGVSAAFFAWWRPKAKLDLPPPLPMDR